MAHYKTAQVDFTYLYANYPHDPQDPYLSIQEYLEDQFDEGWFLHTMAYRGSSDITFVFVPNAQ